MMFVTLYLALIVAANLTVTWLVPIYGVWVTVPTAFLFIGGDFTLRDGLTDAWRHRGLTWKMGLLILAGSGLSYALNRDSAKIAVASAVAWGAAAVVDWLCYLWLYDRRWMVRTNGSNVPSSLVDSFVFPTLAFGAVNLPLTLAQFGAKLAGGFVFSLLLKGRRDPARHEVVANG